MSEDNPYAAPVASVDVEPVPGVVDMEGRKPEFFRLLFLRYGVVRAVGLIPFLGGLYWLIDVLFIFANDQRCIHDHIAGTRVVVAE